MKFIVHQGAPCDPPIVNGVTFKQKADSNLFVAQVEDDHEATATFDSHPNFVVVNSAEDVDDAFPAVAEDPAVATAVDDGATAAALAKAKEAKDQSILLTQQNAALAEERDALLADKEALNTENAALRSKIEELQAKITELKAEDIALLADLQAEADALEAKKAADGKLEPADNMKLGKINKRIAELKAE